MNENIKIKDCSCGGMAIIRTFGTDEEPIHIVQCLDCMKTVHNEKGESREDVIKHWNSIN